MNRPPLALSDTAAAWETAGQLTGQDQNAIVAAARMLADRGSTLPERTLARALAEPRHGIAERQTWAVIAKGAALGWFTHATAFGGAPLVRLTATAAARLEREP